MGREWDSVIECVDIKDAQLRQALLKKISQLVETVFKVITRFPKRDRRNGENFPRLYLAIFAFS